MYTFFSLLFSNLGLMYFFIWLIGFIIFFLVHKSVCTHDEQRWDVVIDRLCYSLLSWLSIVGFLVIVALATFTNFADTKPPKWL